MPPPDVRAVLFVCTGNTCRSVMAEYLCRHRFDDSVRFESAGVRLVPSESPHNAVETLRFSFGINATAHKPRDLAQVNLGAFDLIVAIDDPGTSLIYAALKEQGVPTEALIKWKIEDPFGDDPGAYDRCALAILKILSTLPIQIHHLGSQAKESHM
jgi:protein-tyrosine-phosphatase